MDRIGAIFRCKPAIVHFQSTRDDSTDIDLHCTQGLIGPLTAGILLERFGGTDAGAEPYKPTMVSWTAIRTSY